MIKNLAYPVKNDLCPLCTRGWAATLHKTPPVKIPFKPMLHNGVMVYSVKPKFTWYEFHVYHQECLLAKKGQLTFDSLVLSGEIITE